MDIGRQAGDRRGAKVSQGGRVEGVMISLIYYGQETAVVLIVIPNYEIN